jgi:hypothetical protein
MVGPLWEPDWRTPSRVPMIVRSAGDTGSNSGVDRFVGIIKDLAREHRLPRFRIGYFYSEVGKDYLRGKIAAGDAIDGLDGRPPLDLETLDATDRVVAMAGVHPYIELLDRGADIIIGGHSSDCAICRAGNPPGASPRARLLRRQSARMRIVLRGALRRQGNRCSARSRSRTSR